MRTERRNRVAGGRLKNIRKTDAVRLAQPRRCVQTGPILILIFGMCRTRI
jgi:hypothetical protein